MRLWTIAACGQENGLFLENGLFCVISSGVLARMLQDAIPHALRAHNERNSKEEQKLFVA